MSPDNAVLFRWNKSLRIWEQAFERDRGQPDVFEAFGLPPFKVAKPVDRLNPWTDNAAEEKERA